MRGTVAVLLVLLMAGAAVAQEISSEMVGPGVRHRSFYFKKGPWAIDVLEVDLTDPFIHMETVKGQDHLRGYEKTSSMARRNDREGHWVVGAVNGDFYAAGGVPINCQVIRGEMLRTPIEYSVLGFFSDRKPFISVLSFSGSVGTSQGDWHAIDGVNQARETDQLILYNHYFGPTTETNIWGAEVRFKAVDSWGVNDTVRVVVIGIDSTQGNQPIPAAGGVLSGHGSARNWLLHSVSLQDTLRIVLRLPPLKKQILEAIGGLPRIVRDGKVSIEEGREGSSFATSRHPRTAVGFTQDSTKLFLMTVDGRQPGYSMGMTLRELAEFLIGLGAYQAINLDGGGSTTMVVRNRIVNRPSDSGGERSVANALMVISTAPRDTLWRLNVVPDTLHIFWQSEFQFRAEGIDRFYNPVTFTAGELTWTCDPDIGRIESSGGRFTAGDQHASGWVVARAGSIADSAFVVVDVPEAIVVEPNPIYFQAGVRWRLTGRVIDTGGAVHSLAGSEFHWEVADTSVAVVDGAGNLVTRSPGKTWLLVSYGPVADSVVVSVEYPGSGPLDDFGPTHPLWALEGSGLDFEGSRLLPDTAVVHSPPAAILLRYRYRRTSFSPSLTLKRSFAVADRPDEISVWVYPDGHPVELQGVFQDYSGRTFTQSFSLAEADSHTVIDWQGEWRKMRMNPAEATFRGSIHPKFPVLWQGLKVLFLSDAALDSGEIRLDDLTADFFTGVNQRADGNTAPPGDFRLLAAYPNPFLPGNAVLRLPVVLPAPGKVTLRIFNLLGQEVYSRTVRVSRAGLRQLIWKGESGFGQKAGAGLYVADVQFHNQHLRQKILLLH